MESLIEFLKFLFSLPPERLAGLTALGAIALTMMTLYVVHSLIKERKK